MAINLDFCLRSVEDARMSSKSKEEPRHQVGCCVCACFDHHVKFVYGSAERSTDLPLRLYSRLFPYTISGFMQKDHCSPEVLLWVNYLSEPNP
jgi:hypothetical protein